MQSALQPRHWTIAVAGCIFMHCWSAACVTMHIQCCREGLLMKGKRKRGTLLNLEGCTEPPVDWHYGNVIRLCALTIQYVCNSACTLQAELWWEYKWSHLPKPYIKLNLTVHKIWKWWMKMITSCTWEFGVFRFVSRINFISVASHLFFVSLFTLMFRLSLQASRLGVYKAFVDNYKVALETAEKCSQANSQFQKISEVSSSFTMSGSGSRWTENMSEYQMCRSHLDLVAVILHYNMIQ